MQKTSIYNKHVNMCNPHLIVHSLEIKTKKKKKV